MSPLRASFQRFLRHPRHLWGGLVCIPLAALADIAITKLIGDALDRLRLLDDTAFLRGFFLVLMGIAVVRSVFRFLQRWWIVRVSRWVETELKQDLFDKLAEQPFSFHDRSRSGDLVSRLTADVENVRMVLGPGLMYTLGALVMVPVGVGYLLVLSAPLAAAMLGPLAMMGIGMWRLVPYLERHSQAVQQSLAEIGHRAQEGFAGVRVVKGYGREEQHARRFEKSARRNMEHQIALGRVRGINHAVIWGARDLAFLPIIFVGGWAMIDRGLPAGDLFKFIDLTFKVFWPIISVGWMAGLLPRAAVSARRLHELLWREPEIRDPGEPIELEAIRGALSLDKVSFAYPGTGRPVLRDVSLEVPAGSVLAVVGPTGCGKTTLLNLLARLYDGEGTIRLDGVPIQRLRLDTLRSAIGYVPQDSFLFSETYRDNVQFGADDRLDDCRVEELIRQAAMTDEVARFPRGLDQMLGERGITLSGGQRQRTCIARALAHNPRILVLDDALSAVDTETESRLLEQIRAEGGGRTVILAAHRLSTVCHADRILVLGAGHVEAVGEHKDLLERDGWYRRTWERQQVQRELAEL